MKLLVRNYLASLKERDELDAILPDLLSESGFVVYSRPRRGTTQYGVDVAAIRTEEGGEKRVYLFSVKQGDLTRQDWDGTPQALRSSLNEILDVYIRTRLAPEHENLRIVICFVIGGDVQEQVRDQLTGFIDRHTTARISFQEWNGDRLADLILSGILREELLPRQARSMFQKAVAMVDEPDVSYRFFRDLMRILLASAESSKDQIRALRQINICLWILYVWARDCQNLESAYKASEVAVLHAWQMHRDGDGQTSKRQAEDSREALLQVINVHLVVAHGFLIDKVIPHVSTLHGITFAIGGRSHVDVNLALFDLLSRIGMTSLWLQWLAEGADSEQSSKLTAAAREFIQAGLKMVEKNPLLFLPSADEQCTDIAVFLQASLAFGDTHGDLRSWLGEMAHRAVFSFRMRQKYPSCNSDYYDLVAASAKEEEGFKEATAGSTLLPVIYLWLRALDDPSAARAIEVVKDAELDHCTLQLWLPDSETEGMLYVGANPHGLALSDLVLGEGLAEAVVAACKERDEFNQLSAVSQGFWPVVVLACRHYRLPLPPHFWINALVPANAEKGSGSFPPL